MTDRELKKQRHERVREKVCNLSPHSQGVFVCEHVNLRKRERDKEKASIRRCVCALALLCAKGVRVCLPHAMLESV